ncbi:MAG: DUF1926 domain-containing protein [Planctomycetes bacterium]|nr:DUF1926 domain-containing protein [Planctomycetota bacterium]
MKKKVNFIFCLHNHQPVGNFDDVFEANYRQAYEPFIKLVQQYPEIKLSLHYSGSLLEWIDNTHPKFITDIKSMVKSGQVEIMGGGACDPILTMLPDEDKTGQITYFSDYLKELFGTRPQGMWLAERVWEQYLAKYIAGAGLKYTVVDDFHFRSAGINQHKLDGFFLTEEAGSLVNIFPGSEKLRYVIPFGDPSATIEILKQSASEEGDKIVVYADDGEKFGSWPTTYEHCYQNKWLERFFRELKENADWINFITFSDAIEKIKPRGKVYLPDCSYREMTEWALPAETLVGYDDLMEKIKQCGLYDKSFGFIKGGFWRNFKVKYPEINLMHSKMYEVSEEVRELDKKSPDYRKAREALYHGQCNCPYWHGVFGGFYLPHLRHSIYKYLIKAEKYVNNKQLTTNNLQLKEADFDCDGYPEIKMFNKDLCCYFKPHQGGAMYEFDIVEKEFNPLATVTRRQEAYHYKIMKAQSIKAVSQTTTIHDLVISKEKGLENLLYYDAYPRMSLLDHFFSLDCKLEDVSKSHYCEEGNFINADYSAKTPSGPILPKVSTPIRELPIIRGAPEPRPGGGSGVIGCPRIPPQREERGKEKQLTFSCQGKLNRADKEYPVKLVKLISLLNPPKIGLDIAYQITNSGEEDIEVVFGVEFNLSMLAGNAHDRFYYSAEKDDIGRLVSIGELARQKLFGIKDWYQKIDIGFSFDKPADIWYFPVQSVSQSEGGFELIYQNSVIIPHWKVKLMSGRSWSVKLLKTVSFL